jgi:hypothetical protein
MYEVYVKLHGNQNISIPKLQNKKRLSSPPDHACMPNLGKDFLYLNLSQVILLYKIKN